MSTSNLIYDEEPTEEELEQLREDEEWHERGYYERKSFQEEE